VFSPIDPDTLTSEQKKQALEAVNLIPLKDVHAQMEVDRGNIYAYMSQWHCRRYQWNHCS